MTARDKHLSGPPRMSPAGGVRTIRLTPHRMTDRVTATDDFLVLAHLGVPRVAAPEWWLTIDGQVRQPCTIGYDELVSPPKPVVEAVHQCCGNPLEPAMPTRRVHNVRWSGTDLAALLDELGVDPRARYVWAYGLDHGELAGIRHEGFVKDLPPARLRAGGVLVALTLNGAPLSPEHCIPAR